MSARPNPLLHALLRPRGQSRHRRSGVALLVVITTVMVMTLLITDLTYGSRVRMLVAYHARDRVQAEWLARSGFNLYRIILVANKELEKNSTIKDFADSMGLPIGDALWQMVPVLNTGLLRMLMGSGGDASDVSEEDIETLKTTGQVSEEIEEASREGGLFSDRNFLDFEGDFSAEVHDHESRININAFALADEKSVTSIYESPTAKQLYALMSGEENDQWFLERDIDRWEIIGNLKDWVDLDSMRSAGQGGYEDSLYNTLEPPYLTKNAPFDTTEEIKLVAGWEGEVFDKFGPNLTVFGSSGKINVNNATDDVIKSVVRACSETVPADSTMDLCMETMEFMFSRGSWGSAKEFSQSAEQCGLPLTKECVDARVATSSQTFDIISIGLVGTSAVTLHAVLDFSGGNSKGELQYWRMD